MGVADNMSYKSMYHFNRNGFFNRYTSDDLPSLNVDPEVNTTIKDNPYRSNVEIEGDEYVLNPSLDGLFKAVGKKHKNGGIQASLQPGAFVYSDDKSLKFSDKDHEEFDLKKGKENTPAEVLKRNIDIEHYNKMVRNISDPKKDNIAKRSSMLMLEKYLDSLGNIAYIQERKKGLPQGVPDFANPTPAPKDLRDQEDINKQYAKYGGKIGSYMQKGGSRKISGVPSISGVSETSEQQVTPPLSTDCPPGYYFSYATGSCVPYKQNTLPLPSTPEVGKVSDVGNGYKTANWEFTPWQKESMLYNGLRWASVKREMPMRSHLNPSYVDPSLMNPEQAVGDLRSGMNSTLNSLNTLNPIMARAAAQDTYGQYLNQAPQVRSQYDNQNVGITNQFRGVNNQIANTVRGTNMQNDQTYWMQSAEGRKNFDNMKSYLGDQFMNERLGDASTNQALAYNLLAQRSPAYGYDWKTGNFYRNNKSILDVQLGNSQEDIIKLAKSLRDQGYSDKLIGDILKSKVYQTARSPRDYELKKGGKNPYR